MSNLHIIVADQQRKPEGCLEIGCGCFLLAIALVIVLVVMGACAEALGEEVTEPEEALLVVREYGPAQQEGLFGELLIAKEWVRETPPQFLCSPLPAGAVLTAPFTADYDHPILRIRRPHQGVDLAAPYGTPVRATAAGTVLFAALKGQAGLMVRLQHADDYETAYLHLSRVAPGIAAGAAVAQGQVIGEIGSTGLTTGPHLEYRVRKGGQWIDPWTTREGEGSQGGPQCPPFPAR